jgi:hypothetical protein
LLIVLSSLYFQGLAFDRTWILALVGFFLVGIAFAIGAVASTRRKVRDAGKEARRSDKPS